MDDDDVPATRGDLRALHASLSGELATKSDLKSEISGLRAEFKSDLKSEISGLRAEFKSDLKAEISGLRAEFKSDLKAEISGLRTELKSDLSGLKTEFKFDLKAEISALRTETKSEFARVDRSLDVLARGQVQLHEEMQRGFRSVETNLEAALRREIKSAFERFHADFGILDDQAKADREHGDRQVAEVHGELAAHVADTRIHRKR